jgi:hypothetical protein
MKMNNMNESCKDCDYEYECIACESEEARQLDWTQAQAEEEAFRRHEQWLEMYNTRERV